MLEVCFSVRVNTKLGESVYVVGNCDELGGWNPNKGTALERSTEESDLWSVTVDVAVAFMFEYRYYVVVKHSHETSGERRVMVQTWETNIHPRVFRVSVLPADQKSVDLPVAQYGRYGGRKHIDKGWLTGQTEVRLSLHSNPVEMWKHRDRQQSYLIKCSTMDLRYKDMLSSDSNDLDGEEEDQHEDDELASKVYVSSDGVSLRRLEFPHGESIELSTLSCSGPPTTALHCALFWATHNSSPLCPVLVHPQQLSTVSCSGPPTTALHCVLFWSTHNSSPLCPVLVHPQQLSTVSCSGPPTTALHCVLFWATHNSSPLCPVLGHPQQLSTVSCSGPPTTALHCVLFWATHNSSPLCPVLVHLQQLSTVSCSGPPTTALHCVLFWATHNSSPLCPVLGHPQQLSTVSCSGPTTTALHCVLFWATHNSSPLCPVLGHPQQLSTVSCSGPPTTALHCVLFWANHNSSPLCPVLGQPQQLSTVSCSGPPTTALHFVLFWATHNSSPLCPVLGHPQQLSTVSCSGPPTTALHCVLFWANHNSSPLCPVLGQPQQLSTVSCSGPPTTALHFVLFWATHNSSPLCPVLGHPQQLSTVSCSGPTTTALHCVLFWANHNSSPLCPVLGHPQQLSTVSCFGPTTTALHCVLFCAVVVISFQVLNGLDDEPTEQGEFGTLYRPNDYFIFKAQSFSPQYVGYQFDFYLHHRGDPAPPRPKHVGSAYVLPVNLLDTSGRKAMPINGSSNCPIGQLTVEYLIVKPMPQQVCDMRVSYSRKWKRSRPPLDVGHRGLGSTYNLRECSVARENTIESLSEAVAHGADYVEFDVHLSKDHVPVVYHDFHVCLTLRQKLSDDVEYFEIPVGDLNMKQLQMLQVEHVSEKSRDPSEQNLKPGPSEHIDLRQQPFPSLRWCFQQIDEIAGFNIELKYPLLMKYVVQPQPATLVLHLYNVSSLALPLWCHSAVTPVLSPQCCHSSAVTPVLSPQCCHPSAVTPVLSPQCCHPSAVTPVLSPQCCHPSAVTPVLSPQCCHPSAVTPVLSPQCCHPSAATPMLSPQCCHPSAVTPVLSPQCCHPSAVTPVLSPQCCHPSAATPVLPPQCCHPSAVTPVLSPQCCHPSDVTPVLSPQCCHPSAVTPVLPPLCCHPSAVTPVLSLQCCHPSAVTPVLSPQCCHPSAVTPVLSPQCCYPSVATPVLPPQCCHPSAVTPVLPPQCCHLSAVTSGQPCVSGEMEDGMVKVMDLNTYLDVILAEILQYAGDRMIVISCFHPDACAMVRLKQNRYPVIFLCQGASKVYPPYNDIRTHSLQNAFSFARAERLLGVAPFSDELLQHVEMISWAKTYGLVIFTWGERNNKKETIDELKSLGVDAVIFDRIHEIKPQNENVFKMELKAKLDLLKTVGAINTIGNNQEDLRRSSSPSCIPGLRPSLTPSMSTT
ncbi:Glycerophosphocholine phosphodiesterase GPCPD1 [Lamellibrachia satsuma]|nr:Glycerophosphocholine phosphodiesterase GPCPD1 [Lamellibrachia satsuma]